MLLICHSNHYDKPDRMGVYVYDPDRTPGTRRRCRCRKSGRAGQVKNGFYDAELNAVFLHSAGDSRDDGVIWVYKYSKGP